MYNVQEMKTCETYKSRLFGGKCKTVVLLNFTELKGFLNRVYIFLTN